MTGHVLGILYVYYGIRHLGGSNVEDDERVLRCTSFNLPVLLRLFGCIIDAQVGFDYPQLSLTLISHSKGKTISWMSGYLLFLVRSVAIHGLDSSVILHVQRVPVLRCRTLVPLRPREPSGPKQPPAPESPVTGPYIFAFPARVAATSLQLVRGTSAWIWGECAGIVSTEHNVVFSQQAIMGGLIAREQQIAVCGGTAIGIVDLLRGTCAPASTWLF